MDRWVYLREFDGKPGEVSCRGRSRAAADQALRARSGRPDCPDSQHSRSDAEGRPRIASPRTAPQPVDAIAQNSTPSVHHARSAPWQALRRSTSAGSPVPIRRRPTRPERERPRRRHTRCRRDGRAPPRPMRTARTQPRPLPCRLRPRPACHPGRSRPRRPAHPPAVGPPTSIGRARSVMSQTITCLLLPPTARERPSRENAAAGANPPPTRGPPRRLGR